MNSDGLKIGIITQARVGSSRLPGKVLLKIGSKTLLDIHFKRLFSQKQDVYLATTGEARASELIEIADLYSVKSKVGSLDDVLSRYYVCAKENKLDVIVRVTSDCPLICRDLIDEGVDYFLKQSNWENVYLSNSLERVYPRGMDFEIFSFKSLEWLHLNCLDIKFREHVTPYLYLEEFNSFILKIPFKHSSFDKDRSDWRLCVDEQLDFELIKKLYSDILLRDSSYATLVNILDTNLELININKKIEQKKL